METGFWGQKRVRAFVEIAMDRRCIDHDHRRWKRCLRGIITNAPPVLRCITLLLGATILAVGQGRAGAEMPRSTTAASPADIAAQRQASLDDMLADDAPYTIAAIRWVCALGREPDSVAENRKEGAYFTPDAADSCVTALVRTARDRHLPELYSKLLAELGGTTDGVANLPRAIGAAVLSGNGKVAIGNGKAAEVTPALAFDAGFTVAYQEGSAGKAGTTDAPQLKALAEACLGQHQKAGTCFSAGYLYGTGAFHGQTVSVR